MEGVNENQPGEEQVASAMKALELAGAVRYLFVGSMVVSHLLRIFLVLMGRS